MSVSEKLSGIRHRKGGGGLLGGLLHKAKVPGFKHGGKVEKTGIYKLHKGEVVTPANEVAEFRKKKLGHKNA